MRKVFLVVAFLVCLSLLVPCVYAERGKMKCDGHGDLSQKFYKKAMMIIKSQEELGLSDEQVEKIKDLKISTKKDLIRKKADIDILALDIKAGMWEDTIDLNAVNVLIDKKYEIKKEKAKVLVAARAVLKSTLTADQNKQLKTLCRKGKMGMK
ncbi:Spy/CpxP family protein refolding chaperone [Candidatus Omnitrophota bacterium]